MTKSPMDYFVLAGTRNEYVLVNLLHIVSAVQQNAGGCMLHLTNGQTIHVESSVDEVHEATFRFYEGDEDDDEEGEWDEDLSESQRAAITTQFVEQYKANVAHLTAGATPEEMAKIRAEIVRDKVAAYKESLMDDCGMSEEDAEKCMALMERILSPENIPRPKGFE